MQLYLHSLILDTHDTIESALSVDNSRDCTIFHVSMTKRGFEEELSGLCSRNNIQNSWKFDFKK